MRRLIFAALALALMTNGDGESNSVSDNTLVTLFQTSTAISIESEMARRASDQQFSATQTAFASPQLAATRAVQTATTTVTATQHAVQTAPAQAIRTATARFTPTVGLTMGLLVTLTNTPEPGLGDLETPQDIVTLTPTGDAPLTRTPTPSPTRTHTPTPTATHTLTPSPTYTATRTPTPSPMPTHTPTLTATPSPTTGGRGIDSNVIAAIGLAVIGLAAFIVIAPVIAFVWRRARGN